ncbi:MAG: hypothetical protein JSU72_10540, partial [Deltaproteobacteria bacterium]
MLKKAVHVLVVFVIISVLAQHSHATTEVSSFSILAFNSIWVRQGATATGGNLGVIDASPGPCLNSKAEVTIGGNVYVGDGVSIYGDSVKINKGASVFDAHYNELANNGTIRANEHTPLGLPLDVSLPEFPLPSPGAATHQIPRGETLTLSPDYYGDIIVRAKGSLVLPGGTYHIENLELGHPRARILFQAPTELIINNRLGLGKQAFIGPEEGSSISAKDIRIYVNGNNGKKGTLRSTPKAVVVGQNSTLRANIYAPHGTIWIRKGAVAEGAFIGKDVKVGQNAQILLKSGFGEQPEPTVTFSANPESIEVGQSATLSWSSTDADTVTIDQGIGEVNLEDSIPVSPTETTTYTITATGPSGTATDSATVSVTHPAPIVSIFTTPTTIIYGNSATLSWDSTHAESANIEGIGAVPLTGSTPVSPTETTTYTITVTGPGGTATSSATVTVIYSPTVSLSATPETILYGESSTLSWTSTNADTLVIDHGIGAVALADSHTVTPLRTTTYTITASGAGGTASAQAVVTVKADVLPQPKGYFGAQYEDLIPPDATVGSYEPKRFALITGLVRDQNDLPIADVSVSIHEHSEYGSALTDAEGRFSIPVEGGAIITVMYEKEGLLTSHRKVEVPWNDIAIAETIQMIPQDPASTTLSFDGNPATVITHESTEVLGESGSRSCTMVFTGDNRAYEVDAQGTVIQELTTITTTATEYATLESMPAVLPPASAYTYCVELSVEGVERVKFDKLVVTWVDNFLGFDVGEIVPVGYYDRDRGVWVPSDNGVVVRLLDEDADGIVDALDADGDDLADDLNGNGLFSDEVLGLDDTVRYQPGSTFWRVEVTHFSALDLNWPWIEPSGASDPNPTGPPEIAQARPHELISTPDDTLCMNSYVKQRDRIFHEDIPIPGTDMTLHYSSNRTKGYRYKITVPASGPTVPGVLEHIRVAVRVAGRVFDEILDGLPHQKAEFLWDGLDHLGRPVLDKAIAIVDIWFIYQSLYALPNENVPMAFGNAPSSPTTGGSGGQGRTVTREFMFRPTLKRSMMVINLTSEESSFSEGWALSNHHHFSPRDLSTLRRGDGAIIKKYGSVIDSFAGTGTAAYGGDGGQATLARLKYPDGVAVDAAGNVYIADTSNHRIRKVDPNGIITTIAGTGAQGGGGDGGPATQAAIDSPKGIAVDATGNLYISTYNVVRKVDSSGIITTVAGSGAAGPLRDGGPATEAGLKNILSVAVDTAGNLYIADSGHYRVRKVDTAGIITTVAGNGYTGYSGDGGPATAAKMSAPLGLAADESGNLYIATGPRIRKVDTSGIITTFAGGGSPVDGLGDGGPAIDARLDSPYGLAVDAAGNLYITDAYQHRIRKVATAGFITTVAGSGIAGYAGEGRAATRAQLFAPRGVALDAEGNLYFADTNNQRIRSVSSQNISLEAMAEGEVAFAEENGLAHIFKADGRHERTLDLDTAAVLYQFGYNGQDQLVSITDRFGSQTVIERNTNGVPRAIISPDEVITTLTIDDNNHLTQVIYPDGGTYSFDYTPDGLMTAKSEPEGNRFEHIFDQVGRLTHATDQQGGHWTYTRSTLASGGIETEVLTGEGNLTTFLDTTDSTGAYTSYVTDPSGAQTFFSRSGDGLTVNQSLPCGMELLSKYGIDQHYKFQYVREAIERTPAGLQKLTLRETSRQDTDTDGVMDRITETVKVNGKAIALVTDTLQANKTITSAAGRVVTTLYEPNTLLTTSLTIPGLHETTYGYDTKGRLTSINTQTRQTTFDYDTQGNLASITDPENFTTTYSYDAVGRRTGISRPDGSAVGFTYDKNGNMTVLTNPATVTHGFGYNTVNMNSSYQTPLSGSYSYTYDKDRRLIQVGFPSGKLINNIYDKTRLVQIQTPEGNIDLSYLCGTKLGSFTRETESITFEYDGSLVTSESLGGTLSQSLGHSYNNDFNLTSFSYAGGTVNYAYDSDGLLTGAGIFTISRNGENGLPEAVTGGGLTLNRTLNGFGEIDGQDVIVGGQGVTSFSVTRDDAGRITAKTETVDGVTSNYAY